MPDGLLLSHEEARLSTEPDAMFISWETTRSGRISWKLRADQTDAVELVGSPDLVVEVVSPTFARKDLVKLRAGYARAGIPEYWIVDARRDPHRFEILHLVDGSYEASAPPDLPQPSQVFRRAFVLEARTNQVGRTDFRLRTVMV